MGCLPMIERVGMTYSLLAALSSASTLVLPSFDPAFDPVTGLQKPGTTPSSSGFVSDCGHAYATALHLSGLDPDALRSQGKGKNTSPPMRFIKR